MPAPRIRIIRHEVVPQSGSFEVRFTDGRPSRYFYFDDVPGAAPEAGDPHQWPSATASQGVCTGRAGAGGL